MISVGAGTNTTALARMENLARSKITRKTGLAISPSKSRKTWKGPSTSTTNSAISTRIMQRKSSFLADCFDSLVVFMAWRRWYFAIACNRVQSLVASRYSQRLIIIYL